MAKAGRVLKAGDSVEDDVGVFTIEAVDKRRISRIRFAPASRKDGVMAKSLMATIVASQILSETVVVF
jgi:hypothetical protein